MKPIIKLSFYEFLFQTGSIRSLPKTYRSRSMPGFLFQTGSIRSNTCSIVIWYGLPCFYSKLVRLEVNWWMINVVAESSFYSKLVRLEVNMAGFTSQASMSFLFQTGSIRSINSARTKKWLRAMFLFQTGSIRRSLVHVSSIKDSSVSIPNWFD